MPTITHRRVVGLTSGVLVALFVSGCSNQVSSHAASPIPGRSTTAPTTTAVAPSNVQGPMNAGELVWLQGISRLHRTMDKALVDSPSLTPDMLGSVTQQLRSCTRELTQLGPATERLLPVFELAQQGCAQYDKAATCFNTAARSSIPVDGADVAWRARQAVTCGTAAFGKGSALFADAEVKGFQLTKAAG